MGKQSRKRSARRHPAPAAPAPESPPPWWHDPWRVGLAAVALVVMIVSAASMLR